MALIGGIIATEEIFKDIIIPWWVSTEIIGAAAASTGIATAAIVEEVKQQDRPQGMSQEEFDNLPDGLNDDEFMQLTDQAQQELYPAREQIIIYPDEDYDHMPGLVEEAVNQQDQEEEVPVDEYQDFIQQIRDEEQRQAEQRVAERFDPPGGNQGPGPAPQQPAIQKAAESIISVLPGLIGKKKPEDKPQDKVEQKLDNPLTINITEIKQEAQKKQKTEPHDIYSRTLVVKPKINTRKLQ